MVQNNRQADTGQVLVAATPKKPAVEFPTPEVAEQILGVLRAQYDQNVAGARQQDRIAEEKRAAKENVGGQIQELQRRYQELETEERTALHYAAQHRNVVQGAAAMLAQGGMSVSAVVEPLPLQPHPLDTPQGDMAAHAAQFNGAFPETKPDGYCVHCGQPAWKAPSSPMHPHGATHSFGATCNPEAETSTFADLGEAREVER
ncbi:hypothetical protein ACFYY8_31260 [Streptosporangium sp. NPDC001559]|uniref:hypothetical protein n=1 Tax=Streptosporangium sp. NPDC001559 TaxID=3366187 RepID=UPI0036EAC501